MYVLVDPSGGFTSISSSISKPVSRKQPDQLAVRQVELDRLVVVVSHSNRCMPR